jgi:hypothetical protein
MEFITPRPLDHQAVRENYTAIARAGAVTKDQCTFFEAEALKLPRDVGVEVIVLGAAPIHQL